MQTQTETIKLRDGTRIPWIGFGTGTALSRKDCTETTKLALTRGFSHFDTAQSYKNEEYLGAALEGVPRSQLYITTKLMKFDWAGGQTVEDTLRVSLKKLKTDFVDLFLIHVPIDHIDKPGQLKDVWKQMCDVKKKGLTRSIGVSNFNVRYLKEILADGLEVPVVNQIEFHPFIYNGSKALLDFHAEHGIVTESYGGLSPIIPKRQGDEAEIPAREKLMKVLDKFAASRSTAAQEVSQNQMLLKWLQYTGTIAVTTSSKESRIDEYLATGSLPDFTPEELSEFNAAIEGVHFRCFKVFDYMDE
ncbi:Aldo/keto reductase [Schizopora paradoxa]|uniref:Aldo/keto reductase n=1 Tax=Schizopora paradoxa TaxID=27342 RepID=A0A0H2RXA8_9AGAM|nr:Aldo/keto reductase [Schizopora paradoxa]